MNVEIIPNDIVDICTMQQHDPIVFDYGELEPTVAQDARKLATQIREFYRQSCTGMLDIGRELNAMKERLGHGNFGNWLRAEFGTQERTMQRYMVAAIAFQDESDTVSILPISLVHTLAAKTTPKPIRANIVERLKRGEALQPRTIVEIVDHARWVVKAATREAQFTERQRKEKAQRAARRALREKIDHEKRRAEWQAQQERVENARAQIAEAMVRAMPSEQVEDLLIVCEVGELWSLKMALQHQLKAVISPPEDGSMSVVELMREVEAEVFADEEAAA